MNSKTMKPENSARYPAGYVSLHSTLYVLRVSQCQQPWHSRHPRHPRHPNGVSTLCRHFVVNFENLGILITQVTQVTPNIVSTLCRHPRQPWHSRYPGHPRRPCRPRHPRHRVHTLKTLYWHCRDDDGITTFEISLLGLQWRLICLAARPFQALLSLDFPLRAR
jgi:hypothetical protein